MYEHVRKYVLVDYKAEKPCEMDANIHDLREVRPSGDDADADIAAKVMRDIRSMSDRQQLLFGAGMGFLSGYMLTRTGRYVCICIGAGVIVLQLATQNDYIKFNLMRAFSSDEVSRVQSSDQRRRVARSLRPVLLSFLRKVHLFLVDQPNLTSGLIGGFLIGLGFSSM